MLHEILKGDFDMICEHCGKEIDDNAVVCPYCEKEITAAAEVLPEKEPFVTPKMKKQAIILGVVCVLAVVCCVVFHLK